LFQKNPVVKRLYKIVNRSRSVWDGLYKQYKVEIKWEKLNNSQKKTISDRANYVRENLAVEAKEANNPTGKSGEKEIEPVAEAGRPDLLLPAVDSKVQKNVLGWFTRIMLAVGLALGVNSDQLSDFLEDNIAGILATISKALEENQTKTESKK